MSEQGVEPGPAEGSSAADLGRQFLLAEYDGLHRLKEQSVAIGDKRVDIFIALASAFIAGLALLSQADTDTQTLLYLGLAGASVLFLIGVDTLRQVIYRDILTIYYVRALNSIRSYFASAAPDISSFLLMPTSAQEPRYDWQSSNRSILIVMNGMVIAVALSCVALLTGFAERIDLLIIGLGASAVVILGLGTESLRPPTLRGSAAKV